MAIKFSTLGGYKSLNQYVAEALKEKNSREQLSLK